MNKITSLLTIGLTLAGVLTSSAQGGAKIQVIHNAADVSISTVDIYIMGMRQVDDFQFRSATAFRDIPAGIPLTVAVAPGNSTSASQKFYETTMTLEAGKTYIAIATGNLGTTGYTPNTPFNVAIYDMARQTAAAGNTDVLIYQGSTDLPVVNAVEPGAGTILNNITYNMFAGYLPRPTEDYYIDLINSGTGETLYSYLAPFATNNLAGKAVTILGSGFNNTTANSNGPEFGLYMALPEGGPLVPLPQGTAGITNVQAQTLSVYPNPANSVVILDIPAGYNALNAKLYDMTGRQVLTTTGTTLNVSGLSNGVYLLDAVIDGKAYQQRIIKN